MNLWNKPQQPTQFTQRSFCDEFGVYFGEHACAATSLLNELSEEYTKATGKSMTFEQAKTALQKAVDNKSIETGTAYGNSWTNAANDMWNSLGVDPESKFNNENHIIYAQDTTKDGYFNHFVNGTGTDDTGRETYFDPWTGETGYLDEITLATKDNGGTRTFTVYNK